MATRSTISVKVSETEVRSIYSHWDGYPSHHYPILSEHYNSQELAEKLISLGDISSLNESCDGAEGHTFDNVIEGQTVYYGRDRHDDGVDFQVYPNRESVKNLEEYHYYWNGEKWEVDDCHNSNLDITKDCENGRF